MPDKIKLYDLDKRLIKETEFDEDYVQATIVGKVRIGNKALYYKDGLKRRCIPLDNIDRVFTRISGCNARMCCATTNYDYYRLVVVCDDKEIANIIFGNEENKVDEAEQLLKAKRPQINIGFIQK